MNNSLYEEYMREVLGYQPYQSRNTYDINFDGANMTAMNGMQMQELENCYPDIYKIIFPMVQNACARNTKGITKELIDSMTDEIYFTVEDNELSENNRGKDDTKSNENRQKVIRNPMLNDLIRILILRELLRKSQRPSIPPFRPTMRPPIMQPIGNGRPGMGFNRDYYSSLGDDYDLYEY